MPRFAVWGLICLLVSGAFFVNAATIDLKRRRFLAGAQRAVGAVVDLRFQGTGRNVVSIPTLEFRTAAGALQRTESLMATGFQRFQPGDAVTVWYDPRDPARADVATFAALWGTALLRTGFGVVFLLMGVVGLLIGR